MTTYSYSRLGTFDSCPRKYYYQYVAKIKLEERPENIEAFLGSRVHEALEKLYRDQLNGKSMTKAELVACFQDEWQKQFHDNIAIVKEEYTADDYQPLHVGGTGIRNDDPVLVIPVHQVPCDGAHWSSSESNE